MDIPTRKQMVDYLRGIAREQRGLRWIMTVYRPRILPCDVLLRLIPDQTSIYDIGCGGGVLLSLIARYRNPTRLAGHDIEPAPLAAAQTLLQQAAGVAVPIDLRLLTPETPLACSGYHYVTVVDVLHHLPTDLPQWLRQLYRAMDEDATVVIKDIDGGSLWHFANKVHDLVIARQFSHEPKPDTVTTLLQETGFEILQSGSRRILWYPHFWIVARKPARNRSTA